MSIPRLFGRRSKPTVSAPAAGGSVFNVLVSEVAGAVAGLADSLLAGGATVLVAPSMSGIPQARQQWSIYGGEYSVAPTHYRYNIQRISPVDGSAVVTTTTVKPVASGGAEELHWTTTDADALFEIGGTVDVSFDGGGSYPITTTANVIRAYPTPVILPWVIPDPVISYAAGYVPGTFPLLVDITANLLPALRLLIKVEDATLATLRYFGEIAITEASRISPFTIDLSGATDPAPIPALPALAATDIVSFQLVTPDQEYTGAANNVIGSASEWVAISPTAAAGRTKIRLQNTGTGNAFTPKLEIIKGGINILNTVRDGNPFFGRCVRSNVDKATWDPVYQNTPPNCLGYPPYDGNLFIMYPGDYIELDLFTVDLTGAQLNIHSADPYAPPTNYALTEYGPTGTLLNTINRAGLTYTPNETKTEAL